MEKTLNIYLNETYQVIDETKHDNFESSTFYEIYLKATKELSEIATNLKKSKRENERERNDYFDVVANNILAFTGNRGTGKTSAMLTFIELIRRRNQKPNSNEEQVSISAEYDKKLKELNEDIFFLPIIDPSSFQPADSLISILLACLFEVYNEKVLNENHKTAPSNLDDSFQKVLADIQTLYLKKNQFGDPRDGENPFYTLSRIASSSVVKKNLQQLISDFLEEFNKLIKGNFKFIALVVDDLDLNVNSSFAVIEDIRRYLNIPNLIIICSLRLEQIGKSVEEHYLNAYKNLKPHGGELVINEEVEQMSEYYIEKLFPLSRNVAMPLVLTRGWLRDPHCKLRFHPGKIGFSDDTDKHIEHSLLEYISTSTGVVFLPRKDKVHRIVPHTLREFANFMKFIDDLQKIDALDKGDLQTERLRRFYDYFTIKYPKFYLTYQEEKLFKEFLSTSFEFRNHFILTKWNLLFPKSYDKAEKILAAKEDSRAGFDKCNSAISFLNSIIPYNKAHLGDVLGILNLVDDLDAKPSEIDLSFIIRTILTINIQIELYTKKSPNLRSLIGQSLWNIDFVKLLPSRSISSTQTVQVDYFPIKKDLSETRSAVRELRGETIEISPLSSFFVFGEDHRRDYKSTDNNMELAFSNVSNLTFDLLQFGVWNINREVFESEILPNTKEELNAESIFGVLSKWDWFYQLEVLDALITNSRLYFNRTVKNSNIDRSEGNMSNEISWFCDAINLNLRELNFRWGREHLDYYWNDSAFLKQLRQMLMNVANEPSITKILNDRIKRQSNELKLNANFSPKQLQLLRNLRSKFEHYASHSESGDAVEYKARVLIAEFAEHINNSEKEEVLSLINTKNSDRNNPRKRKALAEYCLSLTIKIAKKA